MRDLNALSDAVIATVKGYVSRSAELFSTRLDGFEKRFSDFVAMQPDIGATIERQVADAVSRIPKPEDGKSVTLDDVMPAICEAVKNVASTIRIPEDGKSVDEEQVKTVLDGIKKDAESTINAVIAAIPVPKNGEDADPEMVREIVTQEVSKAFNAIDIPKPVAPIEEIDSLVKEQVSEAFKSIRVPEDGKTVPVEDVQRMVDEAVTKAMSSVRMPKDGDPGRDAAHIEILPAIDAQKSYARGTFAKHAGGLWRSFETTAGMKGWECIVEGVQSLDVSMPTERECVVSIKSSSGAEQIKNFVLPVMIYRNVFKEGNEFERGDVVTWGGSLWHCNAQTNEKPGDGSKSWTLAAKKGRDGSDAKPAGAK